MGYVGLVLVEALEALGHDLLDQRRHPAEVRVDRHRRGAGLLGEAAGGEGVGPVLVDEQRGGLEQPAAYVVGLGRARSADGEVMLAMLA